MPATPPSVLALSLHRPWPNLIISAGKDVENRRWKTRHRGPLVIHAGQTVRAVDGYAPDPRTGWGDTGFVAVADLTDVHHDDQCGGGCSPWAEPGCWHWQLANARPFPTPIPGRGRQRLWRPPPEVVTAITPAPARDSHPGVTGEGCPLERGPTVTVDLTDDPFPDPNTVGPCWVIDHPDTYALQMAEGWHYLTEHSAKQAIRPDDDPDAPVSQATVRQLDHTCVFVTCDPCGEVFDEPEGVPAHRASLAEAIKSLCYGWVLDADGVIRCPRCQGGDRPWVS